MSQVVLVTGRSTGIGRAVGEHLTAAGCTAVATARAAESLDGVAASTRLTLDPSPDSRARVQPPKVRKPTVASSAKTTIGQVREGVAW
jgi:NAD(P)-dependent dehydrogenase (short-subunit alcohol dehydrogenase family)